MAKSDGATGAGAPTSGAGPRAEPAGTIARLERVHARPVSGGAEPTLEIDLVLSIDAGGVAVLTLSADALRGVLDAALADLEGRRPPAN